MPRVAGPLLARLASRRRPVAVVVNLHGVPERHADDFRRLLERLAGRFELGDPHALEAATAGGTARSTLFVTFDDGLANHAEIAAPILEEHGARALFALPVAFLEAAAPEQLAWFRAHVYPHATELHRDGDVRAMTWEQARSLAERGHRIASHGMNHLRVDAATPEPTRREEIVASRTALEERLPGVQVDGFCWPIRDDPGATAAQSLVRSTYRYALGAGTRRLVPPHDPFRISRANIEVSWPQHVVELQLARATLR